MQELELKMLWKSYNEKVEKSLTLNKQNADDISKMKVQSLLSSMKPIKIFTLIAGIVWSVPLAFILVNLFLFGYDKVSPFFLYSASIQVLLTIIATAVYIYQLDLIYKIDFSTPVITMQESLSKLKISTLWAGRILFLQLPVWTTFYLTENTILQGTPFHLIIQGIVTFSFAFAGIWLFININYKNRNKKWFQRIFKGKEWTPLLKSMDLLEQVEEYKKQN
ncbi:MAG TPA: hypothetical protein PKA85_06710 [Ferruginibacter sp.]|nr:hypothetical protein [Ferruginibacter sp.]